MLTRNTADVIVVGAGVMGAACAYYAARSGLRVTVLDRGAVAGGTTGAGEGNLLLSDKEPGPELELALLSTRLWGGGGGGGPPPRLGTGQGGRGRGRAAPGRGG
ncbi:FAD-dependent oxidoreductase, partial [Streptomyces sp. NPDC059037]|uniref:FAD-dependent oxidoreductase n=1 Tax=Streptomyces sp. NPDC059037 TaxID=3346710 RepID=UPI0036A40809